MEEEKKWYLDSCCGYIKPLQQEEELEAHHIDNMGEKIGDYIFTSLVNVIQYSPCSEKIHKNKPKFS